METLLNFASLIATAASLVLLISALIARHRVKKMISLKRQQAAWVQSQLDRALALVESGNDDEILLGLQILSALDFSRTRLKALPRLFDLIQSGTPRVSRQARSVVKTLAQF
jgi:hypothetical protein